MFEMIIALICLPACLAFLAMALKSIASQYEMEQRGDAERS